MAANSLMKLFIGGHVGLYRLTGGRFGNEVKGLPVLLLTTTGRKTGQSRTVPVVYIEDGGNFVIAASMAGAPTHPAWFNNLTANPDVIVEVGARTLFARAEVAGPEERRRLWAKLNAAAPFFENEYQVKTSREIPLVVLVPSS
jgi:deazaflavin-dependent oxidoreductase (nitroreductase family)